MEALYDRYAPVLLSLCYRYSGNMQDAEDVLHDGFIKIIRNISKFRQKKNGSFEGWMKRIMVNTALNHLRYHKKEKKFMNIDLIQEKIELSDEEGEDELASYVGISQEKVMELVCQLPLGYRTVFNMYVFEGFSHREIAALVNCSESTSKSQLSKARATLRKKLNNLVFEKKTSNIHEKA